MIKIANIFNLVVWNKTLKKINNNILKTNRPSINNSLYTIKYSTIFSTIYKSFFGTEQRQINPRSINRTRIFSFRLMDMTIDCNFTSSFFL